MRLKTAPVMESFVLGTLDRFVGEDRILRLRASRPDDRQSETEDARVDRLEGETISHLTLTSMTDRRQSIREVGVCCEKKPIF